MVGKLVMTRKIPQEIMTPPPVYTVRIMSILEGKPEGAIIPQNALHVTYSSQMNVYDMGKKVKAYYSFKKKDKIPGFNGI